MGMLNGLNLGTRRPLRVAAYSRVSTMEESQNDSLKNQNEFFRKEISEHPDWIMAGVFSDNCTGTTIKGRVGFQRMMRLAEEGKIDYIVTKSISRFSRSTVDTLSAIRKLTAQGVGVYFLEQGLDTRGNTGELVLTILATIAEMESESISRNIRHTFDQKNEMGIPSLKSRYGYKHVGNEWIIIPNEALRIKLAFLMAANGFTFKETADRLNRFEEIDRTGKFWDGAMVRRALTSENYVGDILTNKSVAVWVDGAKRFVPNDGRRDQFIIRNHHEPIVGRVLFEKVSSMIRGCKLAGQKNFQGVEDVMQMAKTDPLLDEVRKYLPKKAGKVMQRKEKEERKWKKYE